jgi:hypothetical protein
MNRPPRFHAITRRKLRARHLRVDDWTRPIARLVHGPLRLTPSARLPAGAAHRMQSARLLLLTGCETPCHLRLPLVVAVSASLRRLIPRRIEKAARPR